MTRYPDTIPDRALDSVRIHRAARRARDAAVAAAVLALVGRLRSALTPPPAEGHGVPCRARLP